MSAGERSESIPIVYSMPEVSKTFTLGASRSRRGRHRLSRRLIGSNPPVRQSFGLLRMRNLLDQSE